MDGYVMLTCALSNFCARTCADLRGAKAKGQGTVTGWTVITPNGELYVLPALRFAACDGCCWTHSGVSAPSSSNPHVTVAYTPAQPGTLAAGRRKTRRSTLRSAVSHMRALAQRNRAAFMRNPPHAEPHLVHSKTHPQP
jgi:hypothetical protein